MIDFAGQTLVDLLVAEMNTIGSPDQVALQSPATTAGSNVRLTVFLYAAIENPYLKTEDWVVPVGDPNVVQRAPLTVDLYFLLTAIPPTAGGVQPTQSSMSAHAVLADAMRVLYEHGVVTGPRLAGPLEGTDTELRITLNPITVEDMTRIWGVFPNSPYLLSVSYLVTPVPIVPEGATTVNRVLEREHQHAPLIEEDAR